MEPPRLSRDKYCNRHGALWSYRRARYQSVPVRADVRDGQNEMTMLLRAGSKQQPLPRMTGRVRLLTIK